MSTAALMVGAGLLLFFLAAVSTRHRAPRERRLTWFEQAWFLSLATWPFVLSLVVAPLVWGSAALVSGATYTLLGYGPALALGVIILLPRLGAGARLNLPSGLVGGLALVLIPFSLSRADQLISAVIAIALLAVTVVRARRFVDISEFARLARYGMLALAACMFYMVQFNPLVILGPCREDKCGISGVSIASDFTGNGNIYGLVFALLLPLAGTGATFLSRIALIGGSLFVADVCVSRTSYIGLIVGIVGVLLFSRPTPIRAAGAWILLGGSVAGSLVPVIVDFQDADFRWRGILWRRAKQMIAESPLVGYGPFGWTSRGADQSFNPSYSPHNIWISAAIAGGALAVLVVVATLIVILVVLKGATRHAVVLFMATAIALGSLETTLDPLSTRLTPFVFLSLLFVCAMSSMRNGEIGPEPRVTHLGALPHSSSREKRDRVLRLNASLVARVSPSRSAG